MPNVSLPGLMGIVSSWHAWVTFREWSKRAANTIADDYCAAGHTWVVRAGTKGRVGFEESYERYAARLWPPPMRKDWLKIYVGIFTGRPDDPTLVEGVPDLFFAPHVNPEMLFGQQLQTNAEFKAAFGPAPRAFGDFAWILIKLPPGVDKTSPNLAVWLGGGPLGVPGNDPAPDAIGVIR